MKNVDECDCMDSGIDGYSYDGFLNFVKIEEEKESLLPF